jgi:mannitol-specific phosphotransferase system IIBC component
MRSLLTKKNVAIAASVASVVVSAVLLRSKFKKIDNIQVDNMTVDDISDEEIVEAPPVKRENKKD